jgi:uncharacterized membrane-anchored protein
MKSVLREKTLLLAADLVGLIWKFLNRHGWPVECAVMCEMMDLRGALCFEAQAEAHYGRTEMGWLPWKFWLLRARLWRAACKVLERLGLADMPF